MPELLAPGGSMEAVMAAVQNGADAVYLGLDTFNARRNAKNFTDATIGSAVAYCRARGVRVYVTLNVLVTDRELPLMERVAKTASRAGADALIVQDLGVVQMLKQAIGDMPIHGSTQMSVHNIEGVRQAAALGLKRVVLARELSAAHIAYICNLSPIEIEVFVHGALCMSYSGQCYMSAVIGGRSGNRGLCAQPCRLPYSIAGVQGTHLSLRDNCLAEHLEMLKKCGVASLKIEGRMKRPEYTAIVTRVYSAAMREGRKPTEQEMQQLESAFSRDGFTDAYFRGKKGPEMLGARQESNKRIPREFATVRGAYLNAELQRVPVQAYVLLRRGEPLQIAFTDEDGNQVQASGPIPQSAAHKALTEAQIHEQIAKNGGTPYFCRDVQILADDGLHLPLSALNEIRRTLLNELTARREAHTPRDEGIFRPAAAPRPKRTAPPQLNVSLRRFSQLGAEMVDMRPALIYLPLEEIGENARAMLPYIKDAGLTFAATLPRVIWDDKRDHLRRQLEAVRTLGIDQCLVGNLGHIQMAAEAGFDVRGDFGLNVFNGQALKAYADLGLKSATASFELRLAQIRDLPPFLDLEMLVYGRLPLMLTESCIIQNSQGQCGGSFCEAATQLSDRQGAAFPIVKEPDCRNTVLNSRKLFLADRAADYMQIGLWAARLQFTTENTVECRSVLARYLEQGNYQPGEYTRGLYYRSVL